MSCVGLVPAAPALAEPAETGYPDTMAAVGDSITRAFNAGPLPFTDWPPASWSTGSSSAVNSHYRRILAANWRILGRNFSDARSGADVDAFAAQASSAVAQRAEYVTVLLGANDVCAGSEARMTQVSSTRVSGQAKAAAITWAAGYDFADSSPPSSSSETASTSAGTTVTLTAFDDVAVAGIEYRLGAVAWRRYTSAVTVPSGTTVTWRAVDVNANTEATKTLTG